MFIHSQIKHNHCLVFALSLRTVTLVEQKKKDRLKITAVVMYAWCLGACGYCSEAWILCVVVDPYVGVLGAVCC